MYKFRLFFIANLLLLNFSIIYSDELIVNAENGLRLRSLPNTEGEIILLIPNNAIVNKLDESGEEMEIAGKKGKWTKVSYQNKTGWVFGGFLRGNYKSEAPPNLKYASEQCACPGGCGYTEIMIRFEIPNKVYLIQSIDSGYEQVQINYEGIYSYENKNIIIKNIKKITKTSGFSELNDFNLIYEANIDGYLPDNSDYFKDIKKAFKSTDYTINNQLCVFEKNKADDCGSKIRLGYFCKK